MMADKVKELSDCNSRLEVLGKDRVRRPNITESRAITCYKCTGLNHIERICNWKGRGSEFPETQCQSCEQFGYSAPTCNRFELSKPRNYRLDQGNAQSDPRSHQPP